MLKQLALSIAITATTIVSSASDQYITIGTNTFGFAFEDTTLSTNMQARIVEDWKVLIAPWTNGMSKVVFPENGQVGELYFNVLWDNSVKNINCNRYKLIKTTDKCRPFIKFEREFTSVYQEVLQFADSNFVAEVCMPELISNLQFNVLSNMPPQQISNYFYYHKIPANMYEAAAQDIKDNLKNAIYYQPSILTLMDGEKNYLTHPYESLWWWVPLISNETTDYMPAIYIDGKWKLHPLAL